MRIKTKKMKSIIKFGFILTILFGCGLSQRVKAQSTYSIMESKANSMKLAGTSSMHDWDMNANKFTGEGQFHFAKDDAKELTAITSLSFTLPAANLRSDKKGLDKNAYEALKTSKHNDILYNLKSATVAPEKDGKFHVSTMGNLTIAGVTREVKMDVYCVVNEDATIQCTGSDKLNMSDYNVKPPSFMFGAMKTGNAVTLDFTVVYKNQNSIVLNN